MQRKHWFKFVLTIIIISLAGCGGGGGGGGGGEISNPPSSGWTGLYVNSAAPNDSGDGLTPSTAKASIQAAIASVTSPSVIHVAVGKYFVNSNSGSQIKMIDGVSLLGGYSTDFLQRDPNIYISSISDMNIDGGDTRNPNRTIEFSGAISNNTVIDGFVITGGSGNVSAALAISSGASPTISNNVIHGGSGAEYSFGINIDTGDAIIAGNVIRGGSSNSDVTEAIYSYDATPKIFNNIIQGGDGKLITYGIFNNSSSSSITNNTIDSGTGGQQTFGIYNSGASPSLVDNNIVFSSGGTYRICILEGDDAGDPATVRNNDFFGCPTAIYADTIITSDGNCPFNASVNCYTNIADVNNAANTTQDSVDTSLNNISVDPVFVDSANGNWHLSTLSITEVTAGAIDYSAEFTTDKDNKFRTAPWSIGAYEQEDGVASGIIISEIMKNPNTIDDLSGEWIELYNASGQPFNINGCTLSDAGTDNHVINGSLVIPAWDYITLAASADPGFTPDYVYIRTQFALGNTDDEVILTCNGAIVDQVAYNISTFPNAAGASLSLSPDKLNTIDNDVGTNWCAAFSSYNGDLGTPSMANDTCP